MKILIKQLTHNRLACLLSSIFWPPDEQIYEMTEKLIII